MTEFRFPRAKGDVLEAFRLPSVSSPSFKLTTKPVEPVNLLPGISLGLISTKTGPVTKDLPYTVNIENTTFSAEQGVLYSSGLFPKGSHLGLVILCHGQISKKDLDQAYQIAFEDLARCLALNGFVVASIRHAIGNTNGSDSFVRHTRFLLESTDINNRFALSGKPVAFVGQSESGPFAIRAAKRVSNFEISNVVGWITAVVGLAPTETVMESDFAGALLVLQGSHDGDTPAGARSILAYESSTQISTKHFCWIHGGNHNGYLSVPNLSSDGIIFPPTFAIKRRTQIVITQNYVTAFLRWRMNAENGFRPLFVGDGTFAFAQAPDVEVQDDLKNGRLNVFARYDTASAALKLSSEKKFKFSGMLQKGKVIFAPALPIFSEIRVLDSQCVPQATIGTVVQWDTMQQPFPSLTVPCEPTVMAAKPSFIEFQAAIVGNTAPKAGVQLPVFLNRLVNGKIVPTKAVTVTIPTPVVIPTSSLGTPFTRAILATIRIPLAMWGVFSPTSVVEVVLAFSAASTGNGSIALANFRAALT